MDIKKALRWILVALSAYLLALTLLFLASSAVFSYVIAKPDKIKSILGDSGIYQQMPGVLYENIEQENKDQVTDISLSDPVVKQAALDSFNPQFFQDNVETAVDGTYAWLNGQTEIPEFVVDAEPAKNNFIDQVVDAKAAEAEKLPACSLQQLRQIDPGSVNIYNLKCLPPGVSLSVVAERAKTDLKNSQEFLGDTKLKATDLKTEAGEPLFKPDSNLPSLFQLAKTLPLLLGLLSAILAAGVVLASPDRRKGLNRIAKLLIGVGLLTLLAPIIIQFTSGKLLPAVSGDKVVSTLVSPLVREFYAAAAGIYYLVGGIMLVAGVILLVLIYKNIIKFPEAKK